MKQKKLRYDRTMPPREKNAWRRRLEEQAELEQRRKKRIAEYLESIRQRALLVKNDEEVRALCREVWSMRHSYPAAVTLTARILEERRARGELPHS